VSAGPVIRTAPGALPLLGHAHHLLRRPWRFLASLPAHGDLVKIKIGPWTVYVPCHPDLVHQMLTDDRIFDKGGPLYDKGREVLGEGVAVCPHHKHRRLRRLVQPAFQRSRLPGYATVMSEQIAAIIGLWRDDQVIDVLAETHAIATRIATQTMFAAQVDGADIPKTQRRVEITMAGIYRQMIMPSRMLYILPTPGSRRYVQARTELRQTVSEIIRDYGRDSADRGDLLSMLLAAQQPASGTAEDGLSEQEMSDQVITFFVSGIATTASTLSWALYQMCRHPDLQRRLQAEADAMLGGRTAIFDDLPGLEFTRRVVTETTRLYPAGWIFTRTVTRDSELGGHPLPADTVLLHSPYILHQRPDLFPDPGRFDPDRWSGQDASGLPRGAFVPFGGGARKCIGDDFTLTQLTLALASIAARWQLDPVDAKSVRPALRATLTPRRLRLRLTARSTTRTAKDQHTAS
jgi:cytochrome P450